MSFRRNRDEWDGFLKTHGEELRECGIPDEVIADKMRFLVFLDHGYDDWGRFENRYGFFDSKLLTDDQIQRLAELVGSQIDERYQIPISSRWQRMA